MQAFTRTRGDHLAPELLPAKQRDVGLETGESVEQTKALRTQSAKRTQMLESKSAQLEVVRLLGTQKDMEDRRLCARPWNVGSRQRCKQNSCRFL